MAREQTAEGAYGTSSAPQGVHLDSCTAVAAKAGDTVELFGVGFGPTTPAVPVGKAFSGAAAVTNPVRLTIGGRIVNPSFAGLSSAGLFQINVTIPSNLGTGDLPLVATAGGVQTQSGVVISLPARSSPSACWPDFRSQSFSLNVIRSLFVRHAMAGRFLPKPVACSKACAICRTLKNPL